MKKIVSLTVSVLILCLLLISCGEPQAEGDVLFSTKADEAICFTAKSDSATVRLNTGLWLDKGKSDLPVIYYSYDGIAWKPYKFEISVNSGYMGSLLKLSKGGKVYMAGYGNTHFSYDNKNYMKFEMDGNVAVSGNLMGLYDTLSGEVVACSVTDVGESAFYHVFDSCTALSDASELNLPTSNFAKDCFKGMFSGCSKLEKSPKLPDVTPSDGCYDGMFSGCTGLKKIEISFSDWGDLNPENWLSDVTNCQIICDDEDKESLFASLHLENIKPMGVIELFDLSGPFVFKVGSGDAAIKLEKLDNDGKSLQAEDTDVKFLYSTDAKTWLDYTLGTEIKLSSAKKDGFFEKVYFITSENNDVFSTDSYYYHFNISGDVTIQGNVLWLLTQEENFDKTLPAYAFKNLFKDCSSLKSAIELPSTSLGANCYEGMFSGCTGVTEIPVLNAKELKTACYKDMFAGTSITSAALPAETLVTGCYNGMFAGCSALDLIEVYFKSWGNGDCTTDWLKNACTTTAKFVYSKGLDATIKNDSHISSNCSSANIIERGNPFYFENESDDSSTIEITKENDPKNSVSLQFSRNGIKWEDYDLNTIIRLEEKGDRVYFRATGKNSQFAQKVDYYHHFVMSGSLSAHGSIMYLLNTFGVMESFSSTFTFYGLFKNCTSLTTAPELPATTTSSLNTSCYQEMFMNCTSLKAAPELPAPTLKSSCYKSMFSGCTSLTTAPVLSATSMVANCYQEMFSGCTSLTTAPELPAEVATKNNCYASMFKDCTSLLSVPLLGVKKYNAANSTAESMFSGCTALSSIRLLVTEVPKSTTMIENWLNGSPDSGTLYCPNLSGSESTDEAILKAFNLPEGWTVIRSNPPATEK